MNTDGHRFKHGDITQKIIRVFYEVYNELGHGFLESVYEKSMQIALLASDLKAVAQIEIPVSFRGVCVGKFSADLGLLLNFGLEPPFKRMIYDNPRKSILDNPCLSVADLLTPREQ